MKSFTFDISTGEKCLLIGGDSEANGHFQVHHHSSSLARFTPDSRSPMAHYSLYHLDG